jgi:signal transduction histidine kinase/ligand-binding sensor domain-containing protein/DNA-binding response OmpR family regulator
MVYRILFACLLSFSILPLFAQQALYQFSRVGINEGLSNNQINCILKDDKGFMWFGTMSGLNRYDGYSFKTFRHNLRDSTSISDNYIIGMFPGPDNKLWVNTRNGISIYDPLKESFDNTAGLALKQYAIPNVSVTAIIKGKQGNYWFVTGQEGIYKYNTATKTTLAIKNKPDDSLSIATNEVAAMAEADAHYVWLIHRNGVLEKLDKRTHTVVYRNRTLAQKYPNQLQAYNLYVDTDGDPWVYVTEEANGLYYFNWKKNTFTHLHKKSAVAQLNEDIVRSVVQDEQGLLWIGTDHGGVNLLNKKDFTINYLLHNPDDEKSLSQNSIYVLYKDNTNIIWVGTFKKGISYYHENIIKFRLVKNQASNPLSLPYDDVNDFAEDAKGNLWIGTNGGGLLYFDRQANRFIQYLHNPADANSLSNNVIVSLYLDAEQKLWIGTYFGGLDRFDGKTFTHYTHNPDNPESLADNRVWDIYEDSQNRLWVGTLGGGLSILDRKTNTFRHYKADEANAIHSNHISTIIEDKQGNLWVATAYGVDVLEKGSQKFTHYVNTGNDSNGLSHYNTNTVFEDSQGRIWIGTNDGLNLFDPQTKSFKVFKKENGLPDNTILGILEDTKQTIWLSTTNGLSNLRIEKAPGATDISFRFRNYDEADGLQGKAFNNRAAFSTSTGELIFGGPGGFNIFRPGQLEVNKQVPQLVFTDFQIFNKSIVPGEITRGHTVLDKAITYTQAINLPHTDNVFTIEFAAPSFFHPEKNKYMYRLQGFKDEWLITDGTERKATFTNLNPGKYVFQVKAANNDGYWNRKGIALEINVLPPFWKTPWAFAGYVLLIIGALLLARKIVVERTKINFQLEQERQEAQRMHELDMLKIRFFTNVSHEFRTPLTLILTPLDKLIKNTIDPEQSKQLTLIHRNARRLLNLVNQLLDFRKLEVQESKLTTSQGDVIGFIREVASSFSDLSEKKNIRFSFQATVSEFITFFDSDKLEKILFNLLSNAFKFTPEQGSVTVWINPKESDTYGTGTNWLEIKVTDTGIGIPLEKQEKIFESFFQHETPGHIVNHGSGIGLAITKEFVKIHGGTITVESVPERGSTFTVLLPLQKVAEPLAIPAHIPEEIHLLAPLEEREEADNLPSVNSQSRKPVVLLVEDNEDFRFYLKDNLKHKYTIIEAAHGKEGWRQAVTQVPDLIVSDVMMPEMDGMELCRKIKRDPRTSHIPVILLTARAAAEQQMEGLETGANDYITKPFNFELLVSRIKNLIAQREHIRKTFQKQIEINPSEVNIPSLDEKLIQKTLALVEKNMNNADFSVEELSRELGMSRVHLYKKLLSLTGKTPLEFIRTVRLKRAAQLLEKSQLTVSEIAYQVGFNNPKYFTKYFKSEFNLIPSAYMAQKRKQEV